MIRNNLRMPVRAPYTLLFFIILIPLSIKELKAQHSWYWNTQMNEESFMLAGAVVGGGAGVGSIYYNPALISDNNKSNLSLNVSLFSLDAYRIENALGDNINLESSRILVDPRFFSYIQKSKKHPGLSFQFIIMGKENFIVSFTDSQDKQIDILKQLPGNERYFTNFKYRNQFSEYWIGGGASLKMKSGFSVGIAMFGLIKSLHYTYLTEMNANPLSDTVYDGGNAIPFYTASTGSYEYVKFNDYRLIWKIGLAYSFDRINIGVNITTPSVHAFSGVMGVSKGFEQSHISNPDGSGFFPDYFVADEQTNNDLMVNHRDPLSIALGIEYSTLSGKQHFYATTEHFFGMDPYKVITATVNQNIAIPSVYQEITPKDWLSIVSGARPVTNLALGYKWQFSDRLMLLTGIKTDYSYKIDYNFRELEDYNRLASFDLNVFHFSGGVLSEIRGHNFYAGIQYSNGRKPDMNNLINLTDPVEYNESEGGALQGDRSNNAKYVYNGLSLFLGITLNFGNNSTKNNQE
jgi:hypothetical protein